MYSESSKKDQILSAKDRILSGFKVLRVFVEENKTVLACLLVILLVWKSFYPAIYNDFANYDDPDYVVRNTHVTSGVTISNVLWAFTSTTSANWHPVTMISHMLDCQLYGTKPLGHHLTNVILHCLNSMLVFLLLQRLTGMTLRSLCVALLFGLHPLRVESVAWISERKDVLSTLFWLLAALAYTKYVAGATIKNRRAGFHYALALFWFLLGLMSKSMIVTFPCVLLLLDFWPLRRWKRDTIIPLIKEKLPFFVLSGMISIVTCFTQRYAMMPEGYLPFSVRLANTPIAYCRYLGKIFYPVNLSIFYPYPLHWPMIWIILSTLFLVGISAIAAVTWRHRPFVLVGWLWFLGILFPVVGLMQAGAQSMADRYSYLPSVGILIISVWSVCEIAKRSNFSSASLCVVVVGVIATCITLTRSQVSYWKDGYSLWQHAAAVTKNNYVAHALIGFNDLAWKDYDGAITNFQETLKHKGDMANVHLGLGIALMKKGRTDDAIIHLQNAIILDETNAEPYKEIASALLAKGRRDEAITNLVYALKLRPDYPEAKAQLHELTSSKHP